MKVHVGATKSLSIPLTISRFVMNLDILGQRYSIWDVPLQKCLTKQLAEEYHPNIFKSHQTGWHLGVLQKMGLSYSSYMGGTVSPDIHHHVQWRRNDSQRVEKYLMQIAVIPLYSYTAHIHIDDSRLVPHNFPKLSINLQISGQFLWRFASKPCWLPEVRLDPQGPMKYHQSEEPQFLKNVYIYICVYIYIDYIDVLWCTTDDDNHCSIDVATWVRSYSLLR